ncbi:TIGR04206 family protein [Halorubrum sp. BV1]|uniref:TIGR04206 family protein n=1 Tax=Halorubrum sp. BV1 TaxID=1498500 RepID=UPI0009B5C800|nr:TIGR04206 family protein [Halorubrum sp. BV1]
MPSGSSPAGNSGESDAARFRALGPLACALGPLADALFVVALLVVPMAVVPGDGVTVVSLWGFLTVTEVGGGVDGTDILGGVGGYPVWRYFLDQPRAFSTLPPSIRAWPLAVGFHLLAAGSALSGIACGREDRRVTGGLLVLAAGASLWVSTGLALRFGVGTTAGWLTVIPVGALATVAVAVAAYGRDLRGIVEA